MKKFGIIISLLFLSILLGGSAVIDNYYFSTPAQKTSAVYLQDSGDHEKEFNVKPGMTLDLDLEIGADIEVEGWNKNVVKANVKITGRDADDVEVEFDQTSDVVRISAEQNGNKRNLKYDATVKVMVPEKFNVQFKTMGGDVKLSNIDGNHEGTTMGGDLDLNQLKGQLSLTTMGGDIQLLNSEVDGNVKTMGGDIRLEDVFGDVNAKSMGGDIIHKNVKRKSGDSIGNEVNITTMGGDLKIDEAMNGASLKTMGGDITVNRAENFVKAETMGGDIEIKSVDGWVKAKTMGGDVKVSMTGDPAIGNRDVTLTSMGGDITLTVPDGLSMDIDIEIAYTREYQDKVKISSKYNISEERTTEWDDSHGSKRKFIYGKGSVAGGKNKIKIKTINGNVYLN